MSDLVRQLAAAARSTYRPARPEGDGPFRTRIPDDERLETERSYRPMQRFEIPDMPAEAPPMDLPSDELAGADISTFGLEVAPKSPFEPDDLPPVIRKKKQRPEPEGPYVGQRRGKG